MHGADILLHISRCGLVICDTLWCDRRVLIFWRKTLLPSSGSDSDSFYWSSSSHVVLNPYDFIPLPFLRHIFIRRLGTHLWLGLLVVSSCVQIHILEHLSFPLSLLHIPHIPYCIALTYDENNKLWCTSLHIILYAPIASSLLRTNIFPGILFCVALTLCSALLTWETMFPTGPL